MNQEEIKEILPHRDSMLLVEEAREEDGTAYGSYHVRGDEYFLQGHFPGHPVVPGVILCEMMAQASCVLLAGKIKPGEISLLTGIREARFREQVKPGDTFRSECRIVRSKGPFYFAEGKGYVDGKLCVSAEFSFAIMEG